MPAAIKYIDDPNGPDAREIEDAYTTEQRERQTEIDLGWKYYRSDMRKPLKDSRDNVLLPLVEDLVDKAVATMQGIDEDGIIEGVRFEFPHTDDRSAVRRVFDQAMSNPAPVPPEQAALDALWKANRKNRFLYDAFLTSAIAGHVVVRIMPSELTADDGRVVPRFVNVNPRNFAAFWQEDDAESVLWYRIQIGKEKKRRQDFVKAEARDGSQGWLIYTYETSSQSAKWERVGEPEAWQYPWSPIVEWQNLPLPKSHSYYGKDDIGIRGNINDAVNFLISNQQRILKYHANPKTVLIGDQLPEAPDEGVIIDGADKAVNLGTAEIMELQDGADLKIVEMMNDGKGTLDMVALLSQVFYDTGREVSQATIKDKIGQITNFGLRVMYNDSLTKRHNKWLEASDGLTRLSQHGLELMGLAPLTPVNVIPPSALPHDPEAQSNALLAAVSSFGLSQDTALERMGFDPDDERAKRDQASRERARQQTRGSQAQSADESRGIGQRVRNALTGGRDDQAQS